MNVDKRKEIKERRHSKEYDDTMEKNILGYLVNRQFLKYEPKSIDIERMEDMKRMQEGWKQDREEGVIDRFKRNEKTIEPSKYPIEQKIIIRVNTDRVLSDIINVINTMIKPEEIYMYDPICNGMGYKYYKGERVIVYQIDKYMSLTERSRIEGQIDKKKVRNKNHIEYDLYTVCKIVIIKQIKWNKKNKEGWKEYKCIRNGYCGMLNILSKGQCDENNILDQSYEMYEILKEIDEKYL